MSKCHIVGNHMSRLIQKFIEHFELIFQNIVLLTEQHLEFLSLKGDCPGSSESIHVKMPHCWKSHVAAQMHMVNVFLIFWTSVSNKLFYYQVSSSGG